MSATDGSIPVKTRLLQSALQLVRERGYDGTTVDELCRSAGVTKGAFFHYFEGKEALAIVATKFWTEVTGAAFAVADYHKFEDPLDRLLGYVDFRIEILEGRSLAECTCFLGTLVQEKFISSPTIRDACLEGIDSHAKDISKLIGEAKMRHAPLAVWGAESLALHTQAVIQGAFILAKAKNDVTIAADMIRHLRRYIELLFHYTDEA